MESSQAHLIELFKAGKFPEETGVPKHIETFISNVFLFDTRVYKLYKDNNQSFNESFRNISGKEKRFDFTTRDFAWNNASTPSIYTDLIGVRAGESGIEIVAANADAEELVIKMNRVDLSDVIFEKLIGGKITKDDSFAIGKGLGESLSKVRTSLPTELNYFDIFKERVVDAEAWMKVVEHIIPSTEIEAYCRYLIEFRDAHKELFDAELSKQLEYGGDIHSHNALYSSGEFFLMDTFSPKDDWLIEYHGTPVYRLATDIWALSGNKELFEACIAGYEIASGKKVNRALDNLYIIYALTISAPYHYMLEQNDETKALAARRIHSFMQEHFAALSPATHS